MSGRFSIDVAWLARESGSTVERATLAELEIAVGGHLATEVEDLLARTVRRSARLSAYDLALWLAANWWRLRWEPEKSDLGWEMSHKVGAAGGGYVWPDLTLVGDGETVLARSRPTPAVGVQPIRYLGHFDEVVPVSCFEQGVDDFVDSVTARLAAERSIALDLGDLWAEVRAERRDPERAEWRKLEAMLGHDPDEAPDGLIECLLQRATTCGAGAVEELAGSAEDRAPEQLDRLWEEARPKAVPARVADADGLGKLIRKRTARLTLPWQRAAYAAAIARETWGLPAGPVSTRVLSELIEVPESMLIEPHGLGGMTLSAGFRNGSAAGFSVFLHRRHPTGRRFALARLAGDHLEATATEKLLPSTDARTARQKFQRAFAQEFLCPFADLTAYLETEHPTDEAIETAAEHFEVSPLVIKTTLVNKGLMDREALVA